VNEVLAPGRDVMEQQGRSLKGTVMNYLNHVVATKGVVHSFQRSAQIVRRFMMGRRKFEQMISFLEENLNGEAKITFCVTACLLAENAVLFRKLRRIGHDVAAHGYVHTNMKAKSKREQIEIIRKCSRVFEQFRIPVTGFRCPYLSYNSDTLDVLQRGNFSWTSNNMILWHNGSDNGNGSRAQKSLDKISSLYTIEEGENHSSLPRFRQNCIDIPITGPDDEMLLERFKVRSKRKIVETWMKVLQRTHEKGELFHLLFHPERFDHIRDCVTELVGALHGLSEPVWPASLAEITQWWRARKNSSWQHERLADGRWRTWVRMPQHGTMLTKVRNGMTGEGTSFFGSYKKVMAAESRNGDSLFPCHEGLKATIGISPFCSPRVEAFLREEGFLVERSNSPDDHPLFVDGYGTFQKRDEPGLLERIEETSLPVFMLWRWPSGARSAFTISADVDSVTLMDFVRRAFAF